MRQKYRIYALLAGANFESVLYMLAAWQIGGWLQENYPGKLDWSAICYLLALLLIARSWYVIFRIMIRNQKEGSADSKDRISNEPKDES